MEFRKKNTPRWYAFFIIAALVIAAGSVLFVRGRPALENTFPAPDARAVPAFAPLRLTFSRPMDARAVANNLFIEPTMEGEITWDENELIFTPHTPWPSGETISVTLTTGARSAQRLPLAAPQTWSFAVARTMLAYLWPVDGPADIYALDRLSGETIRLTETTHGVLDFSISADGRVIYFSAVNDAGGSSLYALDRLAAAPELLLDCGKAICQYPQLAPDGNTLAYERAENAPNRPPSQVWLLTLNDGRASRVAGPDDTAAHPAWSVNGQLVYYDATRRAYAVFEPGAGVRQTFPNETGEPARWAPDGQRFVAPEILFETPNAHATSHLFHFHPASELVTDLTHAADAEDMTPAYAPNGKLIAFARKYTDPERWTPGRQLWLMPASGEAAYALTNAPHHNHTAFAWHPGGTQIVFLRTNQTNLNEPPEIWIMSADGSHPLRLVIGGYNPVWLP